MDSPWLPYIFIVFLLACSAFFSGTEIAFASVNKLRLKKCAERGERCNASLACSIRDHYTEALCTILIGNNLVNIASSSVVFERMDSRIKIMSTDIGRQLQEQIDDLMALLWAYRHGKIVEDRPNVPDEDRAINENM